MKRIKITFLFCLIGIISNSQNTITKVYGEVQTDINRSYKITQIEDTIFLVGGEWNEEAILFKINCNGDTLQSQNFGSQIGGESRIVDYLIKPDGNFVVTGECTNCILNDTTRHIFLMEVDTNLQVNTSVGIEKYKAYYYSPNPILNDVFCNPCLEQDGDAYYLVAVKPQSFTDFYLMKFNESLDTLWSKPFDSCDPGSCFDAPRSITKTEDGLAVLVFNALTDSTTVWHFDFDGNPIWKKRYFNDGVRHRTIIYYPPDKLIIGGSTPEITGTKTDMHLLLLDSSNGDVLDEYINGESENDEILDIKLLNNGAIIIAAIINQPNDFGTYQTSRVYRLSVNPFDIIGEYDQIPNPDVITSMGIRSVFPLNDDGSEFVSVGIRGFYNRTFYHTTNICSDVDNDGYPYSADCDDSNPDISPGAMEVCNGIDDDCNDQIDEGLMVFTYYLDNDNDGFGDPNISIDTCLNFAPNGYIADDQDCNDSNSDINPGAMEICNGMDDNCNNQIDEGLTVFTYYQDNDNDSYGNPNSSIDTCSNLVPNGYIADDQDCDDSNSDINPDALEIPNNGIDEDCDGEDLMTGTNYFEFNKNIKIFPNPFKEEIIISCDCNEQLSVEIINILMQSVWKEQVQLNSNGTNLSLTNISFGVYWVKIQDINRRPVAYKQILKIK